MGCFTSYTRLLHWSIPTVLERGVTTFVLRQAVLHIFVCFLCILMVMCLCIGEADSFSNIYREEIK